MVVIHRQTLGFWLEIGRRRAVLTMIDAGMNHLYPIIKEKHIWLCAEMVVLSPRCGYYMICLINFYPLVN